ncbi:hypothetical protein ACFQFH_10960 [Halobaculum halobium]|uniref:Uncharacterized protein n=1 Tax=Halobaculum halobium TaxID=3032281 RepID=A0ABD5TAL5_9EURY
MPEDDIADLFGNGKIGIDYGMGEVFNKTAFAEEGEPTDSIETMDSLREEGGIVLGQYHRDDLMLLGYVNQDKNIEIIEAGNGTKIKALQLDRYEQVHRDDYPELFNVSKGQQAVHNLHADAKAVRNAFKDVFDEATLNSL